MGGDQVDHRRAVGADHVLQPLRVQAGVGRHPDDPHPAPVQRVEHAGEGGVLDGDRLAGQHLAPDEQVHGLLPAGRDDHLARLGGQPEAAREMAGDGLAQRGQPEREVPAGAGHLVDPARPGSAQDGSRVGERRGHLRRAVHHGQREVRVHRGGLEQAGEEAVGPVYRGRRGAVRHDAGARALAALRHALVAQQLVGRGHGIPAHGQGGGQVALGGQPQARGQLAGVGQPGDPRGQQAVQRAVRGRPVAEQVRQGDGADARGTSHGADWSCHDCANCGTRRHPRATGGISGQPGPLRAAVRRPARAGRAADRS